MFHHTNMQPTKQPQDNSTNTGHIVKIIILVILILANLTFFIYIFTHADLSKISQLNYPASYKGQICSLSYSSTSPFIYIDLQHGKPIYRCVAECPSSWNQFTTKDSQGKILISSFPQEHINMDLGGVCWSEVKQQMIKEGNVATQQILYKQNLLINIRNVFLIILFSFAVSTLLLVYYSLSSHRISILLPLILAGLLLSGTYYLAYNKYSNYHLPLTSIFITIIVIYIFNIVFFKDQLFLSMEYQTLFSQRYNRNQVCHKNVLAFGVILLFNVINVLGIGIVVVEYVLLITTEELRWSGDDLYYHVDKTGWKYVALFLQWYMSSNVIFQLYSLVITEIGYRINLGQNISIKSSFNCHNILLLVQFSAIITFAAPFIKFVELFKPNGARVAQSRAESYCTKVTRCSYWCCGGMLNFLHKFTFNPFLINTIDSDNYDLITSLSTIQHIYHQKYPQSDRCSQWPYRLSNYIIISLISIILLNVLSNQTERVLGMQQLMAFYLVIVVVSNEVSRFNINFWSLLIEVSEFIEISHELTLKQ